MFASIPSPSSGSITIGPISIHAYGLMIALGVLAAVWLAGRRLEKSGAGTREDMQAISIGAVIAGVIGSRIYYVITDKSQPWKDPVRALQIWNGGLGIPGALIAGIGVGMWLAKRRGLSALDVADACAPALAAGAGDRPAGQLVEPGAVRQADHAAVGAADRRRAPHAERDHLSARHPVPPDVPLRGRCGTWRCAAC